MSNMNGWLFIDVEGSLAPICGEALVIAIPRKNSCVHSATVAVLPTYLIARLGHENVKIPNTAVEFRGKHVEHSLRPFDQISRWYYIIQVRITSKVHQIIAATTALRLIYVDGQAAEAFLDLYKEHGSNTFDKRHAGRR